MPRVVEMVSDMVCRVPNPTSVRMSRSMRSAETASTIAWIRGSSLAGITWALVAVVVAAWAAGRGDGLVPCAEEQAGITNSEEMTSRTGRDRSTDELRGVWARVSLGGGSVRVAPRMLVAQGLAWCSP